MGDTFHAEVIREDGYWVAVVDGVRGGATETRRLSRLEDEVRDMLSGLLDLDPDDVHVDFDMRKAFGADTVKSLDGYHEAAEALASAQRRYEQHQRDVIMRLKAESVSLRDAGHLTGLSFQRIQQLQKGA